MNKPTISVVMSVYNGEEYLTDCINSILNQTYTNFEFIIIDDGSTDNSKSIINNFQKKDSRIIFLSQKNKGLPYSLNKAIAISSGKYIARMDCDDISHPKRLELQLNLMENDSSIGVCGSYIQIFGDGIRNRTVKYPISFEKMKIRLLFSVCFAHPSVMIRKSLLIEFNLKYNENYSNSQDYELWSRLSKVTLFTNIPIILLFYRVSNNSITYITNTYNEDHRFKLLRGVFKSHLEELDISNSNSEDFLHFILGLNSRIYNHNPNLSCVINYLRKIYLSNKKNKIYNEKLLTRFLLKKIIITFIYNVKKSNFGFVNLFFSKTFWTFLYKSL